jgi:hypothetical protein
MKNEMESQGLGKGGTLDNISDQIDDLTREIEEANRTLKKLR